MESPSIAILISTSKNAVFLIIAYAYSSTKLEKSAEQVLPGSEGDGGEREGAGGRNGPHNVCIYE
jgi:hypothetical protein